jgi:hypothetical protein
MRTILFGAALAVILCCNLTKAETDKPVTRKPASKGSFFCRYIVDAGNADRYGIFLEQEMNKNCDPKGHFSVTGSGSTTLYCCIQN